MAEKKNKPTEKRPQDLKKAKDLTKVHMAKTVGGAKTFRQM